jgi:hypothetical protein
MCWSKAEHPTDRAVAAILPAHRLSLLCNMDVGTARTALHGSEREC